MEIEITRDARRENLTTLRQFVENACCQWGLSAEDTFAITLAVDEACTNVVVHGYAGRKPGPIRLTIRREASEITVTISDAGRRFDPDAVPVPDVKASLQDRPPGGLGVYLMRQLMDEVRYEFPPGQPNRLTLVKKLANPPEGA